MRIDDLALNLIRKRVWELTVKSKKLILANFLITCLTRLDLPLFHKMKTSIGDLIAFGSLFIASITAIAGGIYWYANSEKKKYGLERDFGHIRRNQEQIQQALNTILAEIDRRFDTVERDVLEIKAVLKFPQHHTHHTEK